MGSRAGEFKSESRRRAIAPGGGGLPLCRLNACSACAGDYEDPDRTAWTHVPEEDDERLLRVREQESAQERSENDDEFPAQEA